MSCRRCKHPAEYYRLGNAKLQGLVTQLDLTGNRYNIALVSIYLVLVERFHAEQLLDWQTMYYIVGNMGFSERGPDGQDHSNSHSASLNVPRSMHLFFYARGIVNVVAERYMIAWS